MEVLGSGITGPQNTGTRVGLTDPELGLFKYESKFLLSELEDPGSPCAKFLQEKLGLSARRIAKAVRNIRAFDGTASTVSMGDAGLLPHTDKLAKMRVDEFFQGYLPSAAYAAYASREDKGASQRDVYFGYTFKAEDILHETLHMFTGLGDEALGDRLGVPVKPGEDTGAISIALKNGGCGR
jgi:hypothetical protein